MKVVKLVRRPALGEPPGAGIACLDVPCPDALQEGEVRVAPLYLSLDPYLRFRMCGQSTFAGVQPLGEAMTSRGVGVVVASRFRGLAEDSLVAGELPWQEEAVLPGGSLAPLPQTSVPASHYLGLLGVAGLTAWFALTEHARPRPAETVVVFSAAGAVGSVAVQLGKLMGARVVGVAGQGKRALLIDRLKLDGSVDRTAANAGEQLRSACTSGIDVLLDLTGGPMLETALDLMRVRGRILSLGQMDSTSGGLSASELVRQLPFRRLRLEGMLVRDYEPCFEEGRAALMDLFAAGRVEAIETVTRGLEFAPQALADLFNGKGAGKHLLVVR